MGIFWFTLALLFFVLWLNKKPKELGQSDAYLRGYREGYREFGDKLRELLGHDEIDRAELETLVDGEDPGIQSEAIDEDTATLFSREALRVEELPAKELTPEQREEKTIRNLNTILYAASFLLVAAAATFVATNMPAAIRLIGIWVVVILFYGAGLLLYQKLQRLRPAAIAFVGTGLAILPFAGYALHLLGGVSGEVTWLVTSLIGLTAYFVAAVATKSQLISYLTMAFVLSLAMSSVAVVSAPVMWYFILLIGVSLLASSVSLLRPLWLPEIFQKPVEQTGQVVTPFALLGSLVIFDRMSVTAYEVVFAVATAHYLVTWLQTRAGMYETIVRVLAHLTFMIVGWDIARQDLAVFAAIWLGVAALQAGYSLLRIQPQDSKSRYLESIWLGVMQGVILCGSVLWAATDIAATGTLVSAGVIGIISVVTTVRLRVIAWAMPALIVSLVAPFIAGRWLAYPAWEWQLIAWIFIIAALTTLASYHLTRARHTPLVRQFLQASFWLYIIFGVATVFAQLSAAATWWIAIVAALLSVVFSSMCRQIEGEIAGGILFIVAVASGLVAISYDQQWLVTALVLISAGSLFAGTILHHYMRQIERRNVMLVFAQAVLAGLLLTLGTGMTVVLTSFCILLAAAIISFGLRVAVADKSVVLRQAFAVSSALYLATAWLLSFRLDQGWMVLVYAVAALLLWASSYVERLPNLSVLGNVALVAATATMWQWLAFDPVWLVFGVAWTTAAILYCMYGVMISRQDAKRQQVCLVSVWILLGGAALLQFPEADMAQKFAVAGTLIALAGTIGIHGYLERNRSITEGSIYLATLGAQYTVYLMAPELNSVFYAHWWAITIAAEAYLRQDLYLTRRLMLATAFITVGTGFKALENGGGYQLLFLIEHLGLLVAGALTQKTWALWWGVATSAAAVLYFLKDYPYMALAFLGLVLIAIVIWRLTKSSGKGNPGI